MRPEGLKIWTRVTVNNYVWVAVRKDVRILVISQDGCIVASHHNNIHLHGRLMYVKHPITKSVYG